jgi:hypothetical protein
MQKEKLAIKHIQTYIKATRSVGPVEWTPYPTDLENAHRDALGKWCKSAHETGHVHTYTYRKWG